MKLSNYSIVASLILASTPLHASDSVAVPAALETITVTAHRINRDILDTPYSVYSVEQASIFERSYRTTPDIFRDIPGTMTQKTAHGQGSPYLRGFTGFQNLFLVDGIRLNNSVFRSGPNQYWNTVDPLSLARLEVVMGPSSVLFGSDGIGGTVNAISKDPQLGNVESSPIFSVYLQAANGSNMNIQRLEFEHALSPVSAFRIAANRKDYGDIESGGGLLPNTGYDETDLDIKYKHQFNQQWQFTLAHFLTHQQDVPRTHKTIFAVPFAGTEVGDELKRDLDQKRQLSYFKLEGKNLHSLSHFNATLSYQQQEESRDRLRSRNRTDQQGFTVDTLGLSVDTGLQFDAIHWLVGLDYYRDNVASFSSQNEIQGPVADDAEYISQALYSEVRWSAARQLDVILGARYSYIDMSADSVQDPTSGAKIAISNHWSDLVGNLRVNYALTDQSNLFAGISEGFRAPNLSDLTRLDSARSNEFEVPSVNLESEKYVSYEVGFRHRSVKHSWDLAAYYTDISDQIILFPTGNTTVDGEVEIAKSNLGNGYVYGAEALYGNRINEQLDFSIGLSYQYGRIDTLPVAGNDLVEDYISRLQPLSGQASLRYSEPGAPWWTELQLAGFQHAEKLSQRDLGDTQRIPPNGTPGFLVAHLRGGYDFTQQIALNWAIENIFDKNYRVHGSGQNEVGRNVLVSLYWQF